MREIYIYILMRLDLRSFVWLVNVWSWGCIPRDGNSVRKRCDLWELDVSRTQWTQWSIKRQNQHEQCLHCDMETMLQRAFTDWRKTAVRLHSLSLSLSLFLFFSSFFPSLNKEATINSNNFVRHITRLHHPHNRLCDLNRVAEPPDRNSYE